MTQPIERIENAFETDGTVTHVSGLFCYPSVRPFRQRADAMIADTFTRAQAADRYKSIYYDGGHKFDRQMQADAFDWFDRFLKTSSVQH